MTDTQPPALDLDAIRTALTERPRTVQTIANGHIYADRLLARVAELEQQLAAERRDHMETLTERDYLHDVADKLAAVIAPEEVIGEHTGMNDPWQNALDLAAEKGFTVILPGAPAPARDGR